MFGTIITTAVGAVTFKMGMEAQRMHSEGMSCGEIAASMPRAMYDTVACAVSYIKDSLWPFGKGKSVKSAEHAGRPRPRKA